MLPTTMPRILVLAVMLSSLAALAQATPDIPQEKIVVVPFPGSEPVDAGVASPPPEPQPAPLVVPLPPPPPQPVPEPPPLPAAQPADAPVDRTLQAMPPPPPPPEQLDAQPKQVEPQGPGAMLDGHPREGAFLSGPGSLTFLLHHTLMTSVGLLGTQLVPRAITAAQCTTPPAGFASCADIWTGQDARIMYLTGTLVGAGVGFASSAIWQFNHWVSQRSATFGIINSFFGGGFLGGLTDLVSDDAAAVAWMTLIGSSAGAWITAIVGGGELAMNKGVLITSGGAWAMIYTALILGIVASTGGNPTAGAGIDALLLTPALGATAMALATLKFNPSVGQVMRANVFGAGVGGAVLLLSALILGPTTGFGHPLPYALAGVGAIGAKTLVSLLWADAAENPGGTALAPGREQRYRGVW